MEYCAYWENPNTASGQERLSAILRLIPRNNGAITDFLLIEIMSFLPFHQIPDRGGIII